MSNKTLIEEKFSKEMIKRTLEYQRKYGFQVGEPGKETYNSEADAFKHAYMQRYLSSKAGRGVAEYLGNKHEDNGGPLNERNMDLWNNAIGREVSSEVQSPAFEILPESVLSDMAAQKIVEKMRSGEMITSPNDPRRFENMELERLNESDRVHYKGEFIGFDKPVSDDVMDRYLEQAISNDWAVPDKENLDKRVKSGELIYVDNYTKADGTKISGYYRRKPVK